MPSSVMPLHSGGHPTSVRVGVQVSFKPSQVVSAAAGVHPIALEPAEPPLFTLPPPPASPLEPAVPDAPPKAVGGAPPEVVAPPAGEPLEPAGLPCVSASRSMSSVQLVNMPSRLATKLKPAS